MRNMILITQGRKAAPVTRVPVNELWTADVLSIGLNDLSYSYGVPGQLMAPVMKDATQRVMPAGKKFGIPVGGPGGAADIKRMMAEGWRFIQGPSDLSLMQGAARYFFTGLKAAGVDKEESIPLY